MSETSEKEEKSVPDGSAWEVGSQKPRRYPEAQPKQKEFFALTKPFCAYGGARGGGKSFALRRKLVSLCLRYDGIRCLLLRRTLPELRQNHLVPLLREYGGLFTYHEREKELRFPNGSTVTLGYLASGRDALRYQGQEYDVIALDEATQFTEETFGVLKACLRGTGNFPRRMYLTCNPGGVGHEWVKRLFVDRAYRAGENPDDYAFVSARVEDNPVLLRADPAYAERLRSLPPALRAAWYEGRWDLFSGQFFPEFGEAATVSPENVPDGYRFLAMDYGMDCLAALRMVARDGTLYAEAERVVSGLTLSAAAVEAAGLCRDHEVLFCVASPDLWNRRQDTGRSGFEVMQAVPGMPPMTPADDRRVPGWRMVREGFSSGKLFVSSACADLCRSLPLLQYDPRRPEDASGTPHAITHSPEALRYAVMSRAAEAFG